MPTNIPKVLVTCGNRKCRQTTKEPAIEINFLENKILFVCPECNAESELELKDPTPGLPGTRTR